MEEAVQTQETNQTVIPEAPETAKTDLDPRFIHLAKKEKVLRSREMQMKDREAKILAKEKEMESWTQSESGVRGKIKADPIQALVDEGYSRDQLINILLNGPQPQDENLLKIQQEIQTLKTEKQKEREEMTQREKDQREQAKKQITSEIKVLVNSSEEFEAINKTNSIEAVMEYIEQTFDEDGTLLTIEEACRDVENHLIDQAKVFASLKKLSPQTPEPEAEAVLEKKNLAPQIVDKEKPKLNTITSAAVTNLQKNLTDKDRRQRAILAFQGKLK